MGVELENIGQAVKRLQHRHHRWADAKLMELGITLVQWDALRAIGRYPNASAHRLAQLTFQTDQSFGALANRLEVRGLIQRNQGPGRAIHHNLTSAGELLLSKGQRLFNEMLVQSFSPLSGVELDTLYELLTRLLKEPDEFISGANSQ